MENTLIKLASQSPALTSQSNGYPTAWGARVPLKVRVLTNVVSDCPPFIAANKGAEHFVYVNSHGAVSAIDDIDSGRTLGLKPNEFEVIEWHE